MHEAKSQLSKLVAEVEQGAEIVIERRGTPVARLSPVSEPRSFAASRDRYPAADLRIDDDFDELPDDLADALGAR